MSKIDDFKLYINEGYTFKGDSLILGGAMLDGEPVDGAKIKIPLKTLNSHGIIAGANGTGKTKTVQGIDELMISYEETELVEKRIIELSDIYPNSFKK
jgi:hypothetical protein